jgi:hypothetical protein
MSDLKLSLELLNGPLDGQVVTLETEATWGKEGKGPLIFPWDTELGTPQARFFVEGESWWLEGHSAPHGTHCVNRGERVEGKTQLEAGDLLKASDTWLLVSQIE